MNGKNLSMQSLLLFGAISLLGSQLAVLAQSTTVFQDAFQSGNLSTLNPTATSPGALTSSRTAYEIASSKSATATTISSGAMTFGNFSTSSGYCEGQALFTSSPVTLNTPGQYIEFYYTFTDTTTLFNGNANDNEQVSIGLYNSAGIAPTNGTALWNGGLVSSSTAGDIGCAKGWVGYCGMFAYTKSATLQPSAIYTRPAQTGANNLNQGLCPVSGYSGNVNLGQISGVQGQPALTVGNQYTVDFRIYYVNATTVAVTNTMYVGAGIGGPVYSAGGWTARNGAAVSSGAVFTFDGLCIGFRPTSSPTTAETMQINNVTVLLVTPVAPSIAGLTNETVVAGTSPILSPAVGGIPTPAYQWLTNGVNVGYGTNATLTLTNVQYAQDGWIYSLVATNSLGVASNNMTLSVIVTPSITGLNNQAAMVGDTVIINPAVSGVPAPTLQWQTNGVNVADGVDANGSTISGSATSTLTISDVQVADGITYSLVASNTAGIVTNSMNLTVASGSLLPSITGPTNITVIQGNSAMFSATASGVPVPTLQWLDQTQTPIPGATNGILTIANVQYSQNGYPYYVVASNSVGSVTNSAILTVLVPPSITSQPASVIVTNTQSTSFTVIADGVPSVAYQWYKNGIAIPVASNNTVTSATLAIASVLPGDASASYSCLITNLAGTTNTVSVSLTVNSLMSATAFGPANGATGICYDTPLTITFNSPPKVGTSGKIYIYDTTNSATPIDTLDMGLNVNMPNVINAQPRTIGGDTFTNYPVIITGNTAVIYPHLDLLTSNQTYYVMIDGGAFTDASGASFTGISANNLWQFTTKPGGPADPASVVVAADGSGDFVTVQGAIDGVASGNSTLTTINIRDGFYREIVDIHSKNSLVLRGQSRVGTIIGYANNNALNGSTHSRMAVKVNANDVAFDNLTITNMTPQDLSQAEALMIESGAARIVVNNCNVDSYQDTILANISTSKAYFYNSLVQGDVDFIWGGGNLFFTNCEIRYLIRAANAAALGPNPSPNQTSDISSNGFSFVNCALTTLAGANPNDTVGRTRSITNGNTALINCFISTNIGGWSADASVTANFRNWYYGCTNDFGAPVTLSNGIALSSGDPNLTLAGNATAWLYGWVPSLSPNITSEPLTRLAAGGQAVSFGVSATGIPDPTYQWFKNGTNILGATSATLNISSAHRSDGGGYYVVVSNSSGSVTSLVANLTYTNTAPVAGPDFTMGALLGQPSTVQIVGGKYSPTDIDGDSLTVTGVGGGTNGLVVTDGTNITYTATNGTGDAFVYTVSDGFGGVASATVSVAINANLQGYNALSLTSLGGGTNVAAFAGIPTYHYALEMTTNLTPPVIWISQATNPAANNGTLTYTNVSAAPQSYYRTRYVP